MTYNPEKYWEERLSRRFNLSGVGYSGFSEYYNKWLYRAKIRALKKALAFYQIDIGNETICDIGCGTGFFVEFYKHLGARNILGIDITSISVENLKPKYPQYNFIRADISSPLLKETIKRQVDIVNIFDVLYHIKNDEAFERAVSNLCDLISNEGFILLSDLCGLEDINVAEHVKFRSKNAYEVILKKRGCKIVKIIPLYYLLNQPIFGKIHYWGIKIDNLLAPIYYYLDGFLLTYKRSNLKLIIAKR